MKEDKRKEGITPPPPTPQNEPNTQMTKILKITNILLQIRPLKDGPMKGSKNFRLITFLPQSTEVASCELLVINIIWIHF